MAPGKPLTARVIANRKWAHFIGRHLVDTPEDHSIQGSRPTHPELLDRLSWRFLESGWNVKRLQRMSPESVIWRQSSRTDRDDRERDPVNRLLSWTIRHRPCPSSPSTAGPPRPGGTGSPSPIPGWLAGA